MNHTMNMLRCPDFIIVGAMKAGTTTLIDLLKQHSSVMINKKELHYFNGNQSKGIDWYKKQFMTSPQIIAGEGTPTYSFLPHVPYNIYSACPNVKLIWIFRDPIYRTYSNYLHSYKKGIEVRTFAKAVDDELSNNNINRFQCYIERSLYVEQVRRYLRYFSFNQMHFILFEKLISEMSSELNRLTNFLEIDPFSDDTYIPHSNRSLVPKAMPLFRTLMKIAPYNRLQNIIRRRIWPYTASKPDFTKSDQERLCEYFYKPNKEFENLLGINLTPFWQ